MVMVDVRFPVGLGVLQAVKAEIRRRMDGKKSCPCLSIFRRGFEGKAGFARLHPAVTANMKNLNGFVIHVVDALKPFLNLDKGEFHDH